LNHGLFFGGGAQHKSSENHHWMFLILITRALPGPQLTLRLPIVEQGPRDLTLHDVVTTQTMDPRTCDVVEASWKRTLLVAGRHLDAIVSSFRSVHFELEARSEVQAVLLQIQVNAIAYAAKCRLVAYGAVGVDTANPRFPGLYQVPNHLSWPCAKCAC
jgi:hypothetical protein